jgi:isoleucyl-tRNA synthetase
LARFPEPEEAAAVIEAQTEANWEKLLGLRRTVLSGLESARTSKLISSALEAKVILNAAHPDAELWKQYAHWLPALFIVSQVEVRNSPNQPPSQVCLAIEKAAGAKCERCWNYSTRVGEFSEYPTVCERCVAALQEIEAAAG